MSNPVVVVGTGLAGYMFAKDFRQRDKERPLIILTDVDGRFYSKPLLSTALTHQKSIEDLALSTADEMAEKLSAEVRTCSKVNAISPKEKTLVYSDPEGEHSLEYGDLVLALGADKLSAALEGDAVNELCSVNNIEDYASFREWLSGKKKIALIGAGFVACEFSNDLINSGYEVTVVAPEKTPMQRLLPQKLGAVLAEGLSKAGVHWRLGSLVKRVDRHAEGFCLTLEGGEELVADGVMSAVGLRSRTALAEAAGLKVNEGIVVDAQLRTSDSHIYALGDCAEFEDECRRYVAPITLGARVLASVLAGEDAALNFPVMPIVVKTPACPVVVVLPAKDVEGEWSFEINGLDCKALFSDADGRLRGFALLGAATRERAALARDIYKSP